MSLPEFRMPTCHRHFWKGYRWWCRKCRAEGERQFEDVCVALWTDQGERRGLTPYWEGYADGYLERVDDERREP